VLPSDVDHFLSKGADVVLGKPLKISELKAAIRMYYRNDDY
jgi:DNA-binding response OmpR family regulator